MVSIQEAIAQRDLAMEQVEQYTDPDWARQAIDAVYQTALNHPDFISDQVWETGLPNTREDRALGPIFSKASRLGWIKKTDRVRPSIRSNMSGKPVWVSLLYGEGIV